MKAFVTANVDFTQPKGDVEKSLSYLLGFLKVVTIIGFQEGKRFNLHKLLFFANVKQRTGTAARRGSGFVTIKGQALKRFRLFFGGDSWATLNRWIARCVVELEQGRCVCFSAHFLPGRSTDTERAAMVRKMAKRTERLNRKGKLWLVACDGNMPIERLAELLDGKAYGEGIIGFVCSRNLKVEKHGAERFPKSRGWMDHIAYWIMVK